MLELMLNVVAKTCLERRQHNLTPGQVNWFIRYVDIWAKWLYANNGWWKRNLKSKGKDGGHNQLYMWVNHWLSAYLLDPEQYQKRHSIEELLKKGSNNG